MGFARATRTYAKLVSDALLHMLYWLFSCYFFLLERISFRLPSLVDAARPSLSLTDSGLVFSVVSERSPEKAFRCANHRDG
jgi:hypothetical protein